MYYVKTTVVFIVLELEKFNTSANYLSTKYFLFVATISKEPFKV